MYTTDRAEQTLNDIRKVFLLYEHDIIKDSQVRDLTYKIVDLYVTKTVIQKPQGQSCKTCVYYMEGRCHELSRKPKTDPNYCCDNWQPAIKLDITKE